MLIEFLIAITFSPPQRIVTLDKVKGEPIQMSWSPDGAELYIESGQRTRLGTFENQKHYVITIASQQLRSVDAPPQWATDYQSWKGNKWAPGDHAFVIDISEENRTVRAVSAPSGGALAKGGESGASTGNMDDAVGAALTSQMQHVITLKLKGQTVGEYVNTQFVPGYTFGWAPQSLGAYIAYGGPDGRLAVLDPQGSKTIVPDARNVLLPAWANDGKKIAFVEKNGKKFDLYVTEVK
jgi:Tol biopolymer transport system component